MPKRSRFYRVISLLLLFGSANGYCADFIDDWIDQKSTYGPSSFETQKRGYITGGGGSMRWRMGRDYLVSATPPRFPTAGCGGIDAFAGGIGFLEADYLIEKLKKIMGDAGATFFFNIALNTVAEPINKEIKSLEGIVNQLNAIQLDDCKASQTIVATLEGARKRDMNAVNEALTDFAQESGGYDLYHEVKNKIRAGSTLDTGTSTTSDTAINRVTGGTKSDLVSGCPAEIRQVFFTPGSLLRNIALARGNAEEDYMDYIRAMAGDIHITNELNYEYVSPCELMTPDRLDDIFNGGLYARSTPLSPCQPSNAIVINAHTYTSISDYVRDQLELIANAILTQAQIPTAQQDFIDKLPGAIYSGLKSEILVRGDAAVVADVVANYVDITSATYTLYLMRDLYHLMIKITESADTLMRNTAGASATIDPNTGQSPRQHTCQLELAEKPYQELKILRDRVREFKIALEEDYERFVNRYLLYVELQKSQQYMASQVKNETRDMMRRARREK